jgi:ribosome assembly protein 4
MKSNCESIVIRFVSAKDGISLEPPLELSLASTTDEFDIILNDLLKNNEKQKYLFSINDEPLVGMTLVEHIKSKQVSAEKVLEIKYSVTSIQPIIPATRCVATLSGHSDSVVAVAFSPDGSQICSGSGDTTVRFWDLSTAMSDKTIQRVHNNWVLTLSWSPDGSYLASGGLDNLICVWDGLSHKFKGKLIGHKAWITSLSWEPCHIEFPCRRIVSSSKDGSLRIWDILKQKCLISMTYHTHTVKNVRWGGHGLIFSASADCSIRIWSSENGQLLNSINAHSSWVNTLALSTDYVLRTGIFENLRQNNSKNHSSSNLKEIAQGRYLEATKTFPERLISGSDDSTMYLWTPSINHYPKSLMAGHQKTVNYVCFSPDGLTIASASFDNSVKLWNGVTGQFLSTLRGHISAVYVCSWSPDNRFLVTASKDCMLKVWNIHSKSIIENLRGHTDEIFMVDWSPEGSIIASGCKDKTIKLWRY